MLFRSVGVFVFFGNKADDVVHNGSKALFCKVFHLDEPLQRQTRLDRHLCALGQSDIIGVVFFFFEQSGGIASI